MQFSKKKNSAKVTLFTLSRRVKAGRKFARPQPLCRIFDFDQPPPIKPSGRRKDTSGIDLPFRPLRHRYHRDLFYQSRSAIDSILERHSSLFVGEPGRRFPWGKGWRREKERERGRKRRKEIRERTSEDSYFPSRWMKRRGEGGVCEWLKVYPKRQVGDHCLDEKTFVPPLHPRLEQCQSTSVIAIPYPYTREQSNESWFLLAAKLCDTLIKVGFRGRNMNIAVSFDDPVKGWKALWNNVSRLLLREMRNV